VTLQLICLCPPRCHQVGGQAAVKPDPEQDAQMHAAEDKSVIILTVRSA